MHPMTRATDGTSKIMLYVAFELSGSKWKLAFQRELGAPRIRTIDARDLPAVVKEIGLAKVKFKLPSDVTVVACYEAGQDGFWLQRWLEKEGIQALVVDPASLEVSRRERRRKTDRLDATKLLFCLIRHFAGEKVWSVVVVPTEDQEDARRLHRERSRLVKERGQHRSRIRGLLAGQGIALERLPGNAAELRRPCDGSPLAEHLQAEIQRELERLDLVEQQFKAVERSMAEEARVEGPVAEKARRLASLKGVGLTGAHVLVRELGWRDFRNRRQLAAAVGLTGTPYQSGDVSRDQGLSKAGNKRVRTLMVELGWTWVRYQPDSVLSRWFKERFALGGGRARRVGIVALARKLLIALWRFAETGVVPEGAAFKPAT
jgi:transposase